MKSPKQVGLAPEAVTPKTSLVMELYKTLYSIRRSEEYIIKYYPENEMRSPMHMSMGQEAIPAAVCHALQPMDQVFATYRSHATFLARTGDTDRFFAELYGKVTGTAKGKAGSMHLAAPEKGLMMSSAIVASCLPVAVGMAFANKQKKNGKVSCVFFGDGALEEGVFWESINSASVMQVPVVFICEDNGLAVYTAKTARHGFRSVAEIVSRFPMDVVESHATAVDDIYRVAQESIERSRKTMRPAFLIFHCYRYLEHVGINEDFDVGYRSKEHYEAWRLERDGLSLARKKLLADGFTEEAIRFVERSIDEKIERSIAAAKRAPSPAPEEVYKDVFYENT